MSRKRFDRTWNIWHYNDNSTLDDEADRLYKIYQIIYSHLYHVNCTFIWVKIQFRYMFRLFMKPSSCDAFHKLKLLSLQFVYGSIYYNFCQLLQSVLNVCRHSIIVIYCMCIGMYWLVYNILILSLRLV
jgi:hypothetical protein